MGISYIVITLFIVLALEALIITAAFLIFTRSPIIGYWTLQRADHVAQIYALQAAVQAEGDSLNPNTTFEPGHETSLSFRQESDPEQFAFWHLDIPYIESGAVIPDRQSFAVLVDSNWRVLASSMPEYFPVSSDVNDSLPEERELIQRAMRGDPDGIIQESPYGMLASVARTIWSKDGEPLGVVYVQSPASGPQDTNLLADVAGVLIPSAMGWLCLMLPIGLVFGVLTTRGMVRRIERLASATAKFKDGDFSQRVPVKKPDEIGMLEQQFNGMAEQLVESFDQRQTLAEQSARREERARIEQEMISARYIQKSLLPEQVPSIPGWHIEPFYRPARQVGGDLYDFLPLPGGRLGIVIGDVTGKGMPAALIMATTCAMIRAATPSATSPGEVLALVNQLLQVQIPSNMFATCFYAILDPMNGLLRYANAGHDIPYLSRNRDIIELRATGMPLGLMSEQSYIEQEIAVTPGDMILFYTDGLVEAHNGNKEMFGFPRLKELLKRHTTGDGLVNILVNELQSFTGPEWEQEDDVTLVLVRKTH
jgi:serine phosphatase RsbU (regulator of sigma subunit)